MATTKYEYDIATETSNGKVSPGKLHREIDAKHAETGNIPGFIGVRPKPGDPTREIAEFTAPLTTGPGSQREELSNVFAAHVGGSNVVAMENHHVETDQSNKLIKEEWFEVDNGDDTFSKLARSIDYTYQGNSLLQSVEKIWFDDGVLAYSITHDYVTSGNKRFKKKVT